MLSEQFLDLIPNAQSIKRKIDKLHIIKIKNFYSVKGIMKRRKRQATKWGEIFVNQISDKGLVL